MSTFVASSHLESLGDNLSAHAWNKDFSRLAISPANNEMKIFNVSWKDEGEARVPTYTHLLTVSEHVQEIADIAWAPDTDRLVTVGHDRTAYVWHWSEDGQELLHDLVVLRGATRACTSVKWSPHENKFAVGTACHQVFICYFEKKNNWWASRALPTKFESSVTALAWHPSNMLLAAGSTDRACRVFVAYERKCKEAMPENPLMGITVGEKPKKPGKVVCDIRLKGWVNAMEFSPTGDELAIITHDSQISLLDTAVEGEPPMDRVPLSWPLPCLPALRIMFQDHQHIVLAGFELEPVLLQRGAGRLEWEYVGGMDPGVGAKKKQKVNKLSARISQFQTMSLRSTQQTGLKKKARKKTLHQNRLTSLCGMGPGGFSTTGAGGALVVWTMK